MNWRGRPLTSHQVIVSSIAATTTATGLTVHAELDPAAYPTGVKISDQQMAALPLARHPWHGDWNYTLRPCPAPAPAPPAPPPRHRRAGCGQDTLTHPALTGLPRHDLHTLATALALPWAAAQEARLYQQRGGPPRKAPRGGRRPPRNPTPPIALTHRSAPPATSSATPPQPESPSHPRSKQHVNNLRAL
jgi:hypothetical protein